MRSHSAHLEELFAKAEAQIRVSLEQKVLLACIYPRLIHFMHIVIFKSPSGPSPRLYLEQIKQGQETASLATWEDGRFTQQRDFQN